MQLIHQRANARPEVFDRIEIGRVGREVEHVDAVVVDPGLHFPRFGHRRVVVHEPPLLEAGLQRICLVVIVCCVDEGAIQGE